MAWRGLRPVRDPRKVLDLHYVEQGKRRPMYETRRVSRGYFVARAYAESGALIGTGAGSNPMAARRAAAVAALNRMGLWGRGEATE
jgi:hypothetical protein